MQLLTVDIFDQEKLDTYLTDHTNLQEILEKFGEMVLEEEDNIKSIFERQNCSFQIDLTIMYSDEIKAINKQTRNVDAVTDVLSFPSFDFYSESANGPKQNDLDFSFNKYDYIDPNAIEHLVNLGDVIICPNKVAEQAEDLGHSFLREFCFLFMHSILHLCGYDHITEEDGQRMFAIQKRLIPRLEEILNSYR